MTKSTTRLKPRHDRVLIENIPEEKFLELNGGVVIEVPDTALGKQPLVIAKVISVGENCVGISEGDTVGYQNGAGTPVNEGEKEYILIRDADLMLLVEDQNG